MKKNTIIALSVLALTVVCGPAVYGWHLDGQVRCPNGLTLKDVVVRVAGVSELGAFADFGVTDADGMYYVQLPDLPGTFTAMLDKSTLPADATIVSPGETVTFTTSDAEPSFTINWVFNSAICGQGGCWFTGGGAKLDPLIDIRVAVKGTKNNPIHSFGGNVYPGCSPTAGDGGNWNHVARGDIKLHFQGRTIQVVKCGNVTPPPPPGSTSPQTPYNFIEFQGTGRLKGIQGNKADYGEVNFYARCEDRNEPGSNGATDGALIDRYYLRVFDGSGTTLLVVNGNSNPLNMDPVPITDGNFQLHVSSCDNPPPQ